MPVYCEQPPSAALARWVECGWVLSSATAVTGHRVPPDGCIDILYDRRQGLHAVGTMTMEQHFDYPEGVAAAGIRLRPGLAGSVLGVSPAELTDASAPLEDLWPRRGRELRGRLDDSKSIQEAMRILLGSLQVPAEPPNPVQRAIEALTAAHGNADLDSVACQANLSPRQFGRRCREESGLTPKRLCRVLRFRHACRMAGAAGRLSWSDLALEAEYFDQAHLIRDFREFTGRTPVAVFSNTGAPSPG
ncbi:MAG TPA: helix-turn-helix domain-containing protein [Bryobacteraceae bacterium]|nr:helix-turn-helix domain-containing protein [Bryobacteraceae bacterium]